MKKLTPFLICLLAVVVGALFVFDFLGVTEPVLYYAQFENVHTDMPDSSDSQGTADFPDNADAQTDTDTGSDIWTMELPSYYSSLEQGRVNKTRDQGELGVCWAFAANAALESRLLPQEQWDFSEDHMIYNNGFYNNAVEGGDYFMAAAYLSAWKGPVTEDEDPYNDGQTNPDAVVVKHLQEALFLDDRNFDTIKRMVYEYGAVESSIYISVDEEQYIDETYYNRYNYTYCYDGKEDANHEIVIIGWDDSYSQDNFNTGSHADGAFICLNSWGSEFGNNGIFFVSYSDACIGSSAEVYTVLEGADNYDHIYQYDDYGWVGRMGFDDASAYFANVYTAEGDENLSAVSFYATDINTTYSVYVCSDYHSQGDLLTGRELYAEGSFQYAGYYTVKLDQAVELQAGDRYAVIVSINTPGSKHPVAIEMDAGDGRTGEVLLDGKESYVSANGRVWEGTQADSMCNVCLKAFTVDR